MGLRLLFAPFLGQHVPFVTLFPAVVFSAFYGGGGPALLTAGSGVIAVLLVLPPRGQLFWEQTEHLIGLVLFCFVSSIIILLTSKMRAAQRQAERTAAAASKQVEWLRVTLASIGDAVIATDEGGRVSFMNAVAEELTGWTQAEAAGRPLDTVFRIHSEQTREPVENPAARVLREGAGTGLTEQSLLLAKGGQEWSIENNAAPIKSQEGQTSGVILVFRDISKRREAERLYRSSAERLSLALEAGSMGVWEWDLLTDRIWWSENVEPIHGLAPGTFGGTLEDFLKLVHPEDLEFVKRSTAEAIEHGCGYDIEFRYLWPDGSVHWMAGKGMVFCSREGRPVRMVGVAMDVTERRRAAEALKESEGRFAAMVNYAPAAIFLKGRQGRYLMVNPVFEQHAGLASSDIIGKTDNDIFSLEAARAFRHKDIEVLATGQAFQFEETFEYAGKKYTFLTVKFPLPDASGKPAAVCGIATNISDRKHAEEALRRSEEEYRILAEGMPLHVFLLSPQGTVEYCNTRWREWSGLSAEQTTPDNAKRLVLPEDYEQMLTRWQASLAAGAPFTSECRMRGAFEQSYRWYLTRATPLRSPDGQIVKWVTATLDIDDCRRAEETVRLLLESSEKLNAALKEADRRKDAFLATLAHELRNPLAPIRNALQIMRLAQNDREKVEQARRVMERQLQQMVRLIDDLLDVSRITCNKLELRRERVELSQVVQSAVETSRPLIDAMGHKFDVVLPTEPIYLHADFTRLAQVFANLLNNAAKYTPPGGQIRMLAQRQESALLVAVRDTGIGIAPEQREHLFQMFAQLSPSLEQSQSGLGIGLALSRGLIEMHGGRIEAKSEGTGKGSEFIVQLALPAESRPAEPPAPKQGPAAAARCFRILVVDDNRDAADSLAWMLQMMGHTVRKAYDGLEAVESATLPTDVVLLDIGMPRLNGYDAARRIRRQPGGDRMTLVALTGWGQEEDKRRAVEAGFDYHLTKPVEPAALERLFAALPDFTLPAPRSS